MSERETEDKERFSVFVPVDVQETETGFSVGWISISSDEEIEQETAINLFEETGAHSWSSQQIEPDGSARGAKKFYFSGDKWKAPWQPKGPKPVWREEADPNQPMN